MASTATTTAGASQTNTATTGSESIKAFVRLKPFGVDGNEDLPVLDQVEKNKVIDKEHNQTYEFETVFGMQDSNETIFEEVIGKNWELIRKGTKMAVFTYGQTSSGKTHTMKGDDKDPGMIPRTLKKIFEVMDSKLDKRYMIAKLSYFEIYNESINDLPPQI